MFLETCCFLLYIWVRAVLCCPLLDECLQCADPFWGQPLCAALQVAVPPKELVLAGKDAAAEYDELAEPQDFQDDPEWVSSLWLAAPLPPTRQVGWFTGGLLIDLFSYLNLSNFFFLFIIINWYIWRYISEVKVKVAQSCPTLCDPMDYRVHGILQAWILEWIAFPFSMGSSQPWDRTQVSHIAGGFFTTWSTRETHIIGYIKSYI